MPASNFLTVGTPDVNGAGAHSLAFMTLKVKTTSPEDLLTSNVYVYFASWTYLGDPAVIRFHWGRIAINS